MHRPPLQCKSPRTESERPGHGCWGAWAGSGIARSSQGRQLRRGWNPRYRQPGVCASHGNRGLALPKLTTRCRTPGKLWRLGARDSIHEVAHANRGNNGVGKAPGGFLSATVATVMTAVPCVASSAAIRAARSATSSLKVESDPRLAPASCEMAELPVRLRTTGSSLTA